VELKSFLQKTSIPSSIDFSIFFNTASIEFKAGCRPTDTGSTAIPKRLPGG